MIKQSASMLLLLGYLVISIGPVFGSLELLSIDNYTVFIENDALESVKSTPLSSFTLDLSRRDIVGITENAFPLHFDGLTQLYLSQNKLSTLPGYVITALPNLKLLSLSKNQLFNINFLHNHQTKLNILRVDDNKITFITPGTFSNQSQLLKLDLAHNMITNLDHTFLGLENLEKLNISHNDLQSINRNSFIGLTSKLSILDLSNNHIVNIESKTFYNGIPQNYLDLSYNDIREIQGDIFHKTLQYLHLQGNLLININPESIKHILRVQIKLREPTIIDGYDVIFENHTVTSVTTTSRPLVKLDLSRSYLVEIVNHAFRSDVYSLKDFDLSRNKLTTLPCSIFTFLPNLERLSLSNNQLTEITFLCCIGHNLTTLLLNNNKINYIEPYTFSHHRNMLELNLADNNISKYRDVFKGLENLKSLDISANEIRSINRHDFSGLTNNLLLLKLNYNYIARLKNGTFPHGVPQENLELTYNYIEKIETGSFHSELENLNLQGNYLSTLKPEWFVGMSNLKIVNLKDNDVDKFKIRGYTFFL